MSFLQTVVDWLNHEASDSLGSRILGDSLLVTLATYEISDLSSDDTVWDDSAIWQIATARSSMNLATAAAFATYLSVSIRRQTCDDLMHAEAYNYLRDMLLLVLKHQFLAAEESIAVLVCPVLCHAISCLLVYSRHATVHFMLHSPWTMNLCLELRALLEADTASCNPYISCLKHASQAYCMTLLQKITRGLCSELREDDLALEENISYQIIYDGLAFWPRLVLTAGPKVL